jgi:hypothetical protein
LYLDVIGGLRSQLHGTARKLAYAIYLARDPVSRRPPTCRLSNDSQSQVFWTFIL